MRALVRKSLPESRKTQRPPGQSCKAIYTPNRFLVIVVRSLQQYALELKKVGKREFLLQYGKPALLGVGMVADVVAGGKRGPTGTMKMTALTDEVQGGSLEGRAWLITKGTEGPMGPQITAGRSAYNDMVIADYTISERHCQFRYEPGRILLSDLGSLNGTFVNGVQLGPDERAKLRPSDTVVLGRFMFTFLKSDAFFALVEQLEQQARS